MTSTLLVLLVVAAAGWLVQSLIARRAERAAAGSAADFSRALAALTPDEEPDRGRRPRQATAARNGRAPRPSGRPGTAKARPRRPGPDRSSIRQAPARRR